MESNSAVLLLARLGWAGKAPFAKGTVATATVGIPVAWLLGWCARPLAMAIVGLLFFVGCYVAGKAAEQLQREDPGEVVIDELVGYLVTMVGFPHGSRALLVGFAAFRLFDIWKPWPVRCFDEQVPGGLGIVMDDVAAGCYAHAVVWMALALWP
jgi:phosphatidylglycerophosphatase A